jgi:FeS assembly protein IscX
MEFSDIEDVAIALYDSRPDTDPLQVRFTDLLNWILELEGFTSKREESSEGKLEAIQMAWFEEWKDNQG